MDEKHVFEYFTQHKVITLDQLVTLLNCPVITARRRLKQWKTYTSINKNGRFYTLPQIPVFDKNGLWRFETIHFSKHGNLKQTIMALIDGSPEGLRGSEIAELVGIVPNSSFLSRFKSVAGVKREKHKGRFIYLSDRPEVYSIQNRQRSTTAFPSDAEAVVILVQLIKNPQASVEQLADHVWKQGLRIDPDAMRRFLQFHDLLKKTSDTMP